MCATSQRAAQGRRCAHPPSAAVTKAGRLVSTACCRHVRLKVAVIVGHRDAAIRTRAVGADALHHAREPILAVLEARDDRLARLQRCLAHPRARDQEQRALRLLLGGRDRGRLDLALAKLVEEAVKLQRGQRPRAHVQRLAHEPLVRAVQRDGHVRLPLVDHLLLRRPEVVEEVQAVVGVEPARPREVQLVVPPREHEHEPRLPRALLRGGQLVLPVGRRALQVAQELDVARGVGAEPLAAHEEDLRVGEGELHAAVVDVPRVVPAEVAALVVLGHGRRPALALGRPARALGHAGLGRRAARRGGVRGRRRAPGKAAVRTARLLLDTGLRGGGCARDVSEQGDDRRAVRAARGELGWLAVARRRVRHQVLRVEDQTGPVAACRSSARARHA